MILPDCSGIYTVLNQSNVGVWPIYKYNTIGFYTEPGAWQ